MKQLQGTHLIVDAHVEDARVLSRESMFGLFDRLVEALDMTYLVRPQAVEVELDPSKLQSDDDEGGWSYWCMITTSHIAAHTWELRKAVMLDVFSCKPFDTEKALQLLENTLGFTSRTVHIVDRWDAPVATLRQQLA